MSSDRGPRLLADGMLGRLARWLRLLGYDTAYSNDACDHELARQARAEGRILLTRDRELARRRGLETVFIQSQELDRQLEEVRHAVGQPGDSSLSRCSICNVELEEVAPEQVADQVPRFVLRKHAEFRRCPSCGRVYWPGTHVDAIDRRSERLDGP